MTPLEKRNLRRVLNRQLRQAVAVEMRVRGYTRLAIRTQMVSSRSPLVCVRSIDRT